MLKKVKRIVLCANYEKPIKQKSTGRMRRLWCDDCRRKWWKEHEVIMAQKIKYIPSYIILDQPSRPYYDNKNEEFINEIKLIRKCNITGSR